MVYAAKFDFTSTRSIVVRDHPLLTYFQLIEKYIYEFDDVFTDKLPDKLLSPDALCHRIVFEDEKISVNGRMFPLPTWYWPLMKDFLDEHLAAGCIQHSSSHITSGT